MINSETTGQGHSKPSSIE